MSQMPLFYDDIYQALSVDVMALGGSKVVGSMLWPQLKPDKAGEKLLACTNRSHAQKLDLEELLFIQRESRKIGSYATSYFIASDTGFAQPQPVEPEDEKAQLMTAYVEAVKQQAKLTARMEKVMSV